MDGCVDGIGSVSRNCSDREEVEADLSDDVTACCIFLPSFASRPKIYGGSNGR